MTKEEFLLKIKELSNIDVPSPEQEALIDELVSFSTEETDGRIASLEQSLEDANTRYNELQERYRQRFWHGDEADKKKAESDGNEDEDDDGIPSLESLFK